MVEVTTEIDENDVLKELSAIEIIDASNESLVDFINAIFDIAEDDEDPALIKEVEACLKKHRYVYT